MRCPVRDRHSRTLNPHSSCWFYELQGYIKHVENTVVMELSKTTYQCVNNIQQVVYFLAVNEPDMTLREQPPHFIPNDIRIHFEKHHRRSQIIQRGR